MTKQELIQRVQRDCRLTRKQAAGALAAIGRSIAVGLSRGGKLRFGSLGSFSVGRNPARAEDRPRNGKRRARRRAARLVRFTPARALRREAR